MEEVRCGALFCEFHDFEHTRPLLVLCHAKFNYRSGLSYVAIKEIRYGTRFCEFIGLDHTRACLS